MFSTFSTVMEVIALCVNFIIKILSNNRITSFLTSMFQLNIEFEWPMGKLDVGEVEGVDYYQSAVIIYSPQYIQVMRVAQWTLLLLLVVGWVSCVDYGGISNVDQFSLKPIKKGLTYQATVWPRYESNWAGRFSCNNCNPFEGDQTCDKQLPLVCITSAKSLQRPLYRVAVEYTPFAVVDGGFYDGWTGGVIQVTVPVRGYDLLDYTTGNNICKGYFGSNAKWAKFNDGFYTPYMNQRPISAWGAWDWAKTKNGGWNFWGYFNHHYRGRAWVYVDGQPNGNCGI